MQPFLLSVLFLFLSPQATLSQEIQIPIVDVPYDTEFESSIPKIAIIGAGAGGASTAYHLAQLAEEYGKNVSITIFERSGYIGGRSTTINVFGDPRYPVELGACIFVPENIILSENAKKFGLLQKEPKSDDGDEEGGGLGIWDGTKFIYTYDGKSNYYWELVKLVRKYGLAPIRARSLAKAASKLFSRMYDAPIFPFTSLTNASLSLGLTDATNSTAAEYLQTDHKVSNQYAHDFIQTATRVNYGQNLNEIQALEALVSIFGSDSKSIEGGNWQIFAHMILESRAKFHLNTPVIGIEEIDRDEGTVWRVYTDKSSQLFDGVVLASPYHMSNISINVPISIPPVDYMTVHVTYLAIKSRINPGYFNVESVPSSILTTLPLNLSDALPTFTSLTQVRTLPTGEIVYKIFSPDRVSDEHLAKLFVDASIDWIYRKVWQAYPKLDPIDTFAPIELYPVSKSAGLWYTSGIESFISTMETSALSGKNVAALLARRLWDNNK